jgi:hypothetical protein
MNRKGFLKLLCTAIAAPFVAKAKPIAIDNLDSWDDDDDDTFPDFSGVKRAIMNNVFLAGPQTDKAEILERGDIYEIDGITVICDWVFCGGPTLYFTDPHPGGYTDEELYAICKDPFYGMSLTDAQKSWVASLGEQQNDNS